MLSFLLFLTVTLVTSISAPTPTACDPKIKNLHGAYNEKDFVDANQWAQAEANRWFLTQVNDSFTLRTTQSGVKKTITGTLVQNQQNCKWTASATFQPENAQYQLTIKGPAQNSTLVFTKGSKQFVLIQNTHGPKLGGFWVSQDKKEWRCKQTYSFLQCWNQVGKEGEGVLTRQGIKEKWQALIVWVGADKNVSMYVERDEDGQGKQLVFPNNIWDRRQCNKDEKHQWNCDTTVPKIAGSYKANGGATWQVTQKGITITLAKPNGKTARGDLKQRPNRCYWEADCSFLDESGKPTTESAYTVTVRPAALYLSNGNILRPIGASAIEEEADRAKLVAN